MKSFPSYSSMMECDKILEIKKKDGYKKAKKAKVKGGFNGKSSGALIVTICKPNLIPIL